MTEFHSFDRVPFEEPQDILAELHATLGRMYATGAMDEEVPFITNLIQQVESGALPPNEAQKLLRAKMQTRNEYH